MNDITAVRNQILAAFADVEMLPAYQLIPDPKDLEPELEYMAERDDYETPRIDEAVNKYWRPSLRGEFDMGVLGEAK